MFGLVDRVRAHLRADVPPEDGKDGVVLEQWVLYVVLFARVVILAFLSVGVLFLVSLVLPISVVPSVSVTESVSFVGLISETWLWFVVFAVVSFLVTVVAVPVWMGGSWLVAALVYRPLREDLYKTLEELENEESDEVSGE